MSPGRHAWRHDAAGPVVRPYAVTRGRIRSTRYPLDLVTLVVAVHTRTRFPGSEPEHGQVLRLCDRPLSVAEVAAQVSLPLAVVKVLLGDLIEHGHVIFRSPMTLSPTSDPNLLQAVLDGIRNI